MIQNRKRTFQSKKGCSKMGQDILVLEQFLRQKIAFSGNFVPKSVQKCDRTSHTQKRAARTHIPHTFQNGFRTHTHTCDRTSHVCVRARTFATHTLLNSFPLKQFPFIFFQNMLKTSTYHFETFKSEDVKKFCLTDIIF